MKNRDTFIFYRSFFEAIKELSDTDRLAIYDAICNYSLNFVEPDLKGINKAIWLLIQPQIAANQKRFENGILGGAPIGNKNAKKQPKNNRNSTKKQPKNKLITMSNEECVMSNVNVNKNENELNAHSPDYIKFNEWLKENAPFCSNEKNFPHQITEDEFLKLKQTYNGNQIADIILQIENRKDLRKRYSNLYRTVMNWLKKEVQNG